MIHKKCVLPYSKFYAAYDGDKGNAWREYAAYGGLPIVMKKKGHEEKAVCLQEMWDTVFLDNIIKQNRMLHDKPMLGAVLDMVCASAGSLTNPRKIEKALKAAGWPDISNVTVGRYLNFFMDAALIRKAMRYDIKRRKEIGSPMKYYVADAGLLNARLSSLQVTAEHGIMETILYNELRYRGFDVHVGVLEYGYKDENKISKRMRLEIDFVADKGSKRYYIQSAFTAGGKESRLQVARPLRYVRDSFKKIVVVKDDIVPWNDEFGILYIGVEKFLLEENSMDM